MSRRPSIRAFFANFGSYDASLPEKLRLAVVNSTTKMRTGQSCCGHPGQPGC